MRLLAIDIGSSSVKAGVIIDGRLPRRIARETFTTDHGIDDRGRMRASVRLARIDTAVRKAIASLGPAATRVHLIAPSTMAPSWLALDAQGRPLTDVVTHQDRRSVEVAHEIERRVGRVRHLKLAGNRPFSGGISSTTWAWHLANERSLMKRAALVGHLGTWLAHALTGARVIDMSNAGFTGLMDVRTSSWSDALIDAIGLNRGQLPEIVESNVIVGNVTRAAARHFGITAGTPMMAGCIDGSAAMFAARPRVGQLVNVSGSTDVLALCADAPRPHQQLLTRPLGVGARWLSVATIAAAGSAIDWSRVTFFSDLTPSAFYTRLGKLAGEQSPNGVRFDADLAGSRTAIDPTSGAIAGLTLSTSRDDVLRALIAELARRSAARLALFEQADLPTPRRDVFATGGLTESLAVALRAHWPKRFTFRGESEATLRGLAVLAEAAR